MEILTDEDNVSLLHNSTSEFTHFNFIFNFHHYPFSSDHHVYVREARRSLPPNLNRRRRTQITFHPDTIATILSLLDQAKSQSKRGSVLITTAHGKFFSNGFDLAYAQAAGSMTGAANRLHQMVESFKPVVAALLDLPMPTIAALNGHAAAAGLIFALSHDYVFMRKDRGVLYMSEVDIGLSMPDYFSALVRAKIGSSAARRELLLSGKKIRGEEAVGLGIIDSAAYDSAEGVVEASMRLGEKLAAKKWSGDVYASIRKSLYPELCVILGVEARVFGTPKL